MKIKEINRILSEDREKLEAASVSEEDIEKIEKEDKRVLRKERKLRNFQRLVLYIFIIFFIIWLLFRFGIGIISAPNDDMRPAFHSGDMIIFDKLTKQPGIDDIIAFEKGGTMYIGRVVAKGGDTVEILETGGVKINNAAYTENYIYEGTLPLTTIKYPLTLKDNEYFVLVDSREHGEDSRYFGPVKKSEIAGRVAGLFRRSGF